MSFSSEQGSGNNVQTGKIMHRYVEENVAAVALQNQDQPNEPAAPREKSDGIWQICCNQLAYCGTGVLVVVIIFYYIFMFHYSIELEKRDNMTMKVFEELNCSPVKIVGRDVDPETN